MLGTLTLLLASLATESRNQLLLASGALILAGLFFRPLARNYGYLAILFLNTILFLLLLEFAATAVLATVRTPLGRELLGNIMGRPSRIVDHYLGLPYYKQQPWSEKYWQEFLLSLREEYSPYVIWRSPEFSSELLNIDRHGIRRTPGARCGPGAFRVYVFGGSTVWGWGAPDWGTIPAYLQKQLAGVHDGPVCVVNYGENAFITTQELIQLLLLLEKDDRPDVVIFIDGVNAVLAASQNGTPGVHQNFSQIAAFFAEPEHPLIAWLKSLHTLELFKTVLKQFSPQGGARQAPAMADTGQLAAGVVRTYMNDYRLVNALGHAYGFDSYFFLQPYILAGKKQLTAAEQAMPAGLSWVFDLTPAVSSLFAETYQQIESNAPRHEHLYSLAGVFDAETEQIWLDTWGHMTPVGNEKVAAAIVKEMSIP